MQAEQKICTCGVPDNVHGTHCGWVNAGCQFDDKGVITDERHPGFGKNYALWFQSTLGGKIVVDPTYVADLKGEISSMGAQITELATFLFDKGITRSIGSHGGAIGEAMFQMQRMQAENASRILFTVNVLDEALAEKFAAILEQVVSDAQLTK